MKKDRHGEFFADLTLNNKNRPKREVIKETNKKLKKEDNDTQMYLNENIPEGIEVDDEDILGGNSKEVGDIDLYDMKKSKNSKNSIDLNEFGFNNS